MSRTTKQILYGFFYLILWVFFFWLVYLAFFRSPASCFDNVQNQGEEGVDCGGPCTKACFLPTSKSIQEVGGVKILYPGQKKISLLVEIQNSNSNLAANFFNYHFLIYDSSGKLLGSIDDSSFIYANEIKYLAVPGLNFDAVGKIGSVELVIDNVNWVKPERFPKPQITIQGENAGVKGEQIQVQGKLADNDTISFAKVEVLSVFYGQLGQADGVSATEIDNLAAGEVKPFSILHPSISGVDLSKTQVFVYARRP